MPFLNALGPNECLLSQSELEFGSPIPLYGYQQLECFQKYSNGWHLQTKKYLFPAKAIFDNKCQRIYNCRIIFTLCTILRKVIPYFIKGC